MQYTIVPVTADHLDQMEEIERLCFSDPWSRRLLSELLENEAAATLAAVGEDGAVLGYAGIQVVLDEGYVNNVAVRPEYRRQGTASAVTARLTREILDRGKVPFYCCAWSNVKSARNAVRCGYHPAWVELTAKPVEYVDKMNGR